MIPSRRSAADTTSPKIGISNTYLERYRLPARLFFGDPMRLTAFTDFALRALMRLAGEPARSFATNEIAAEFGISRHHLANVVRDLADGGFISPRRGAGGGLTLARPPQSITLGQVVRALEARHALVECFRDDGGACVLTPRCRL